MRKGLMVSKSFWTATLARSANSVQGITGFGDFWLYSNDSMHYIIAMIQYRNGSILGLTAGVLFAVSLATPCARACEGLLHSDLYPNDPSESPNFSRANGPSEGADFSREPVHASARIGTPAQPPLFAFSDQEPPREGVIRKFEAARVPVLADSYGWYAGRCFSSSSPDYPNGALLMIDNLVVASANAGPLFPPKTIPVMALVRDEQDPLNPSRYDAPTPALVASLSASRYSRSLDMASGPDTTPDGLVTKLRGDEPPLSMSGFFAGFVETVRTDGQYYYLRLDYIVPPPYTHFWQEESLYCYFFKKVHSASADY